MMEAAEQKEFWELKAKFREMARKDWPGVNYPELPWLFDQMGIDPKTVVQYPISKTRYKVFLFNEDGTKQYRGNDDHKEVVTVYRNFTDTQRKLVKEWWALLPQDMVIA